MANSNERGKKFLLDNGVPEAALGLINENGLQQDYLNNYTGPKMEIGSKYNPTEPNNQLEEPEADADLRRLVGSIPPYSEYWKQRIDQYNQDSQNPVDPEQTLDLVMRAHPGTETLDLYAQRLHEMAEDSRLSPKQLVEGFVVFTANVDTLYDQKVGYGNTVRKQFGFGKHPHRKNSKEIVTEKLKQLRDKWH